MISTRISEYEKSSLIDNFFINFSDMHCTNGNSTEKNKRSLTMFSRYLKTQFLSKEKDKKILKRDYTNLKTESLLKDVIHFEPERPTLRNW